MKFKYPQNIQSLLLNNTSLGQTVFKNTFWLTLGTGISKLLNFVLIIYVARILGAAEYGKFAFALAFVSLFTVVADLGVSTILVREFAKEKEREKELYSALSLKIILGFGMLILILIGSFFITPDIEIKKIILILALFSLINSFIDTSYAFFQARQKMEYQAGAAILGALAATAFSVFALLNFPSAENLSWAFFFGNALALIIISIFFHFRIFPLNISWNKAIWKKLLLMSWPLAFTALFGLLYTYIDSVMLGYFGQITETGWYNAAYRVAWMGYIFTGLAVTSFYPILSKAFQESKAALQKVWNYQMDTMIILAVPLVAGSIILAPRIIDFVYGSDFSASVLAFQILIVMVGILLLYAPFHQALIVANHQIKLFWTTLVGALVNIVLNVLLIPKYSLYGSATATVITQFLIFFLFYIFTLKFTPIRFPSLNSLIVLIGVILSVLAMIFVISKPEIYNLNVFLSVIIGAITYFGVLFVLKNLFNYFGYQVSRA